MPENSSTPEAASTPEERARGRPDQVFDPKLQHERTSLAWERTAVAGLVVGALMTRVGAKTHLLLGAVGLVQVCFSAGLLVWSGRHYEDLHGVLRAGESPTHPAAARLVGLATTVAIGLALLLAVVLLARS